MAVSATTNSVSYTGNGSTTSFAVTFAFQGTGSTAELEVIERTIATGAEATKSYTTHYTVTGGNGSTGAVVAASAPADTVEWHIRRTTTRTQTVDYTANDPFPADTHELALDRLAMGLQEVQGELDRSFKVSRTTSITTPEFVDDAAARADKLLGFAADGNSIEAVTGRVNTVTASTVTPTAGAAGSGTASFTESTGALALGIPQGSTGHAGISMQYSTTTADADPGAGFVRFNNASLNSATIMYVDDTDGTTDISAWVQSWDNSSSGSKGFITIAGNPNSASPLVIFKVNGTVTDASGYTKIPVAYVSGSTSISNSAEISVQFSPAGDGDVAGLDYTFSTTTADADPGTGTLRLNHGTIGSATAIYIDDSDANSADISAYLLTWDDSTNTADRGQIYITKKSAPANFAIFKVSGASTDASGYVKLAVTHVSSSGSFSNADPIAVEFNRTGNAGEMPNPLTTRGDVVVRSASAPARLAIGAANTVLTTAGTDPAWSTIATAMIADDAITLAKMAGGTDGNLITYDASGDPAHVAAGSSGQVLTSQGAGSVPVFAAAAAGVILQIVTETDTAVATGTTTIPNDTTIPQNTEGDEYMTATVTPTNASNRLLIQVNLQLSASGANSLIGCLFQDANANALAVGALYNSASGVSTLVAFSYEMAAGTTSSTTFKVRAGGANSQTITFNGVGGSARYGVLTSSIVITEIQV